MLTLLKEKSPNTLMIKQPNTEQLVEGNFFG